MRCGQVLTFGEVIYNKRDIMLIPWTVTEKSWNNVIFKMPRVYTRSTLLSLLGGAWPLNVRKELFSLKICFQVDFPSCLECNSGHTLKKTQNLYLYFEWSQLAVTFPSITVNRLQEANGSGLANYVLKQNWTQWFSEKSTTPHRKPF